MTTACVPTTAVTGTSSLLSTVPETGRGQASLWTAAAAPDHRLWTTLRGPLDPSRLPTCPHPRRRRRVARNLSITTNQRRDDLRTLPQAPVAKPALVNIDGPKQVGHSRASKWAIPGCQKHFSLCLCWDLRADCLFVNQLRRGDPDPGSRSEV